MKRSKTFLTKAAMLLIVALFSLTGARAQQALPYEYGFENNNLSTDGWVLQGAGNQTGIYTGNGARHTGTYGFAFYYTERNAYLISPVLTGSDGWGVYMSFYYRSYNSSYPEQFQVGYTTDENATDASTFTYGEPITSSLTSWQEFSNMYPDDTKRIAIKYIYTDGFYLILDDFSFKKGSVVIHGNENFTDSTHVVITCDGIEGATILYSTDKGTSWNSYPEEGFTLYETTTVIAKATKEGLPDSPVVKKLFLKSSDIVEFTWNLRNAPTGGPATADQALWTNASDGTSTNAKMTLEKGSSSTNANAHLGAGGNNDYTGMYSGQTLTFEPVGDYVITSIEITTPANSGGWNATYYGNNLNDRMTLSNATKTHTNNTTLVTITPVDGSVPVVATFSDEVRVIGVKVHYAPASSPYIAIKAPLDETVNETSASVTDATLAVVYNRVSNSDAAAVLCDANGNAVTEGTYNWITVDLTDDDNKNLTYTVTANTTFEPRTAYVKVTAGGIESPVVAIIQDKPYTVKVGPVGYTTFVAPADVEFPSPLIAYIVYEQNGTAVKLSERASVPAGTPVVVKTEETLTETKEYALLLTTEPADVTGNLLKASTEDFAPSESKTIYCLANKSRGVGFYPVKVGVTVPAGKAYLEEETTPAKEFLGFDFDDPTGIDDVNVNLNDNDAIYNLAGQRLQKMQKGINIVNGKKIMVK